MAPGPTECCGEGPELHEEVKVQSSQELDLKWKSCHFLFQLRKTSGLFLILLRWKTPSHQVLSSLSDQAINTSQSAVPSCEENLTNSEHTWGVDHLYELGGGVEMHLENAFDKAAHVKKHMVVL